MLYIITGAILESTLDSVSVEEENWYDKGTDLPLPLIRY
jgi:hypothetical protein